MDLEAIIKKIQDDRLSDSDAALKNIASSEKYLQQSYEGRYLFELIQNVRDANKTSNTTGSVFIELKDNTLSVSNTGAPFSEKGINSITTIGDSPKESQEFIGFKGIGFKSVFEVSEIPLVITEWGAVEFNKIKTKQLLIDRNFQDREIPLFFIPHFNTSKLTEDEVENGIVTKIILPLKSKTNLDSIHKAFDEIGVHQLLLLGCLNKLIFTQVDKTYDFEITEYETTDKVCIRKNDEVNWFKHFKPSSKIDIPQAIIDQLEDKEKEIYEKEPYVDISLVFDLDEKGKMIKNERSKLYLFYPTEISSGFEFIIHSYFLVNPERKALRNSPLNIFILQCIADYLSNEWLGIAKKQYKGNFLSFLAFKRNEEASILNFLYDRLIESLKDKNILFDSITKKYYKTDEIILADGFYKGLFPDNKIGNKRLVYIDDKNTRDWLIAEFTIEYLSFETIADNIEKECKIQKGKGNIKYFENLYKYLVEYNDLNLSEKKILLTSRMQLLSSEDDVFYGMKDKIDFPLSIQKKIHFIHPKIVISDKRQGKGQTGFIEYNTELLVNRLLKLYDDSAIPPLDILISLLKINIPERLLIDVRQKVLLPVYSKTKWLNPFLNPIYVENSELKNLYSPDKFIDFTELMSVGFNKETITEKLLILGAWNVPAIYFSDKTFTIRNNDSRYDYLNSISGYSTPLYQINGDWLLDIPLQFNFWFTITIRNNWNNYVRIIENDYKYAVRYKSQTSYYNTVYKNQRKLLSTFVKFLKEEKWIVTEDNNENLSVKEVVGIEPLENLQVESYKYKKFIKVFPIQFSYNVEFIDVINLVHLDTRNLDTFKNTLTRIYNQYKSKQDIEKDFKDFYNKILSKLFDLYNSSVLYRNDISTLKYTYFLGINELNNKFEWKLSNQIYYIEDKPSYNILPIEIKRIIQPHFTNRDKNRFGQIGKKLGLDFKKVFNQKVANVNLLKSKIFYEWFPNISECLALVEAQLSTNLDNIFDNVRISKVNICSSFDVIIYKETDEIITLSDKEFKIEFNDNIVVFVNENLVGKKSIFYANVLNDILVELLGRDLNTIRITLSNFIAHNDKSNFLESYEVSQDRIDEIKVALTGYTLNKQQLFWLSILNIKTVTNPLDYLIDGRVDIESIFAYFNIPVSESIQINNRINFDVINQISNIEPLFYLFNIFNISVKEFNDNSGIKIDFSQHYNFQIEGIKQKCKPLFVNKLYDFLSDKDTQEKANFQDNVDAYFRESIYNVNGDELKVDVNELYISAFRKKYPYLSILPEQIDVPVKDKTLKIYRTNKTNFDKLIGDKKDSERVTEEFLAINTNRSILYFYEAIPFLLTQYNEFYTRSITQLAEIQANSLDLSQYQNNPNLSIIQQGTNSVESSTNFKPKGNNSNGSRYDGSTQNPKNNLIGLVGEKSVYELLLMKYQSTEWVSKNAAKANVNPEGSDSHGYDITYVDENNQVQYIEVKSKSDNQNHFYISYPEYCMALEKNESYHIIIVKNALDNDKREIIDIGNIFLLDNESDLFNNKKFTANFNTMEIYYK